jgi:hypothetical protein
MEYITVKSILEWAEKNGGIEGLKKALAENILGDRSETINCIKLAILELEKPIKLAAENYQNYLRDAEVKAAIDSADSAKKSARWAFSSFIVSFFALVISLYQISFFKNLLDKMLKTLGN